MRATMLSKKQYVRQNYTCIFSMTELLVSLKCGEIRVAGQNTKPKFFTEAYKKKTHFNLVFNVKTPSSLHWSYLTFAHWVRSETPFLNVRRKLPTSIRTVNRLSHPSGVVFKYMIMNRHFPKLSTLHCSSQNNLNWQSVSAL